jgi:hypothetical protein
MKNTEAKNEAKRKIRKRNEAKQSEKKNIKAKKEAKRKMRKRNKA